MLLDATIVNYPRKFSDTGLGVRGFFAAIHVEKNVPMLTHQEHYFFGRNYAIRFIFLALENIFFDRKS